MTSPLSNPLPQLPVLIGIDGSASALQAARWAADEAAGRGVPMRLLYVVDPDGPAVDEAAETALRTARAAITAPGPRIDIESEIVPGHPVTTLLHASAGAVLLCVGAVGFRHFADGRVGSTAQTLAARAHCPVAIIRDGTLNHGPVVALVDDLAEASVVLQLAVDEAVLRGAVLRVVVACERRDSHTADRLNRTMSPWIHRNPGLEVDVTVAARGILNDLVQHTVRPQLLVVGPEPTPAHRDLFSPHGYALLQRWRCALLIANDNRAL